MKVSETTIAASAADWLEACGFTVYEEVQCRHATRADLVGVCGALTVIVECKTAWSTDLYLQCASWHDRAMASQVYACAPFNAGINTARWFGQRLGFGVLGFAQDYQGAARITVSSKAPFVPGRKLHKLVPPEQCRRGLGVAAGSQSGGHYTPFRGTCDRLRALVARRPGITLKDAVGQVGHHYSTDASARNTLAQLLSQNQIKGLRIEKEGGRWVVYPVTP